MPEVIFPESAEHVHEFVAWAAAEDKPLTVAGRGSKGSIGPRPTAQHVLDLSKLSGITAYEPEELILQAKAGTTIADIESALAAKEQMLAFEPPDLGPLFGNAPQRGTIGGTLACNHSGPRRFKAGAARDHFLGARAFSGRGEEFKTGGRVVKNVTGYDLCKVLAGSYGTLAVMTDVTVKVLPAAEKTRTVLVIGLDDEGGQRAMTRALTGAFEVSGATHLPAALAAKSKVSYVSEAGNSITALRIEGPEKSVAARCAALRKDLLSFGETEELHSANSRCLWQEIRDVQFFVGETRPVWRISIAPQSGHSVGTVIGALDDAECFYDWGGGLIWAMTSPDDDCGASAIRNSITRLGGGHATLMRLPQDMPSAIPVFHPLDPAIAALNQRIKWAFDPKGILNPGLFPSGA